MTTDQKGVRLGDLLTQAGLLKAEELREAMQIAKHQSLPVGRVLIMSGYVSDGQLRSAVQAQSLLKDGLIEFETVISALSVVGQEDLSLEEAFAKIGYEQAQAQPTNKLGELLIESGLVSKEQLDLALAQCSQSGLPLGRILMLTGIVVEPLVSSALNAQVLVRDKKISREQAVQGLKAARERQISLEQSLAEHGLQLPSAPKIRLGEIIVRAGLLEEERLMEFVEMGLLTEKPIGQIFIQQNILTEPLLQAALDVQKLVSDGKIAAQDAGQVVALVAEKGMSLDEAVNTVTPQQKEAQEILPLYQFLQLAGRISPQQIEEAIRAGTRDAQIMGLMLRNIGAIDDALLSAALGCSDFMGFGILSVEQAIVAFNTCQSKGITLEETFVELGWYLNQPYSTFTQHSSAGTAQVVVGKAVAPPIQGSATLQLPPVDASDAEFLDQVAGHQDQVAQAFVPPPPPGYTPLPQMPSSPMEIDQAGAPLEQDQTSQSTQMAQTTVPGAPQPESATPAPQLAAAPQPETASPAPQSIPGQQQEAAVNPPSQPLPDRAQSQQVAEMKAYPNTDSASTGGPNAAPQEGQKMSDTQDSGGPPMIELGNEGGTDQPDSSDDSSDKPRKRLIDLIPGRRPDQQ